jgi:hypothetical protein
VNITPAVFVERKKMKPSSNWLSNLILVIQECEAETGQNFHQFLSGTFSTLPLDTPNYLLVERLKQTFNMEQRRRDAMSDMHPEIKPIDNKPMV